MKNNRGFTLVELLAMLVVLGIIMGVTIPNITGILSQSKKTAFIADANKMVETAKIKIVTHKNGSSAEKIPRIKSGECIVLTLNYLNDNEDIGKGPNDGAYLEYESYVIYKRNGNKNEYYVRLIEKNGDKYSGIQTASYDEIEKETVQIEKIPASSLQSFDENTTIGQVQSSGALNSICTSDNIKDYK